ncbi:MAG: ExbD/TolR family protein [Luteolibacter sp.]
MARRTKSAAHLSEPPKLEVSSLIDICFLLLIYFLATSTLIPRESDLQMRLPGPVSDVVSQPIIRPLFIGIQSDGGIHTGIGSGLQMLDGPGDGRLLPLLAEHLALYASATRGANEDPMVQIYADPEATQQRVVDVLNALAKAKIQNVTFTDLLEM